MATQGEQDLISGGIEGHCASAKSERDWGELPGEDSFPFLCTNMASCMLKMLAEEYCKRVTISFPSQIRVDSTGGSLGGGGPEAGRALSTVCAVSTDSGSSRVIEFPSTSSDGGGGAES